MVAVSLTFRCEEEERSLWGIVKKKGGVHGFPVAVERDEGGYTLILSLAHTVDSVRLGDLAIFVHYRISLLLFFVYKFVNNAFV